MSGTCSRRGRVEKCIQHCIRELEGKRTLGRPRRRWESNIRMDLRETGCEGVDLLRLAQDRGK